MLSSIDLLSATLNGSIESHTVVSIDYITKKYHSPVHIIIGGEVHNMRIANAATTDVRASGTLQGDRLLNCQQRVRWLRDHAHLYKEFLLHCQSSITRLYQLRGHQDDKVVSPSLPHSGYYKPS